MNPPRLVLTSGEPAGIGPDLILTIAADPDFQPPAAITVTGDRDLFYARAKQLNLPCDWLEKSPSEECGFYLQAMPTATPVQAGRLNPANAAHVLGMLDYAIDGCLAGDYAAMVTGPLHKGVINQAGQPFTGHTEYLSERSGGHPVMVLTDGELRVALATTHLPLKDVPAAITPARLKRVITTLAAELGPWANTERPRILVAGLNPHAGESGHLGDEEVRIISPTLEALRAELHLDLIGPLPADTLFSEHLLARADAVLAMYHDQGLPVLKYRGFGRAVNVTLGLPIIRTSVDHGTALELAGTGRIHAGSLKQAIYEAIDLIRARGNNRAHE